MKKRSYIIIIPSAILLCSIFVGGMNYTGFCLSQGRYLSDEEKISAGISYIERRDTVAIKTKDKGIQRYKRVHSYLGEEDFRSKNAQCCEVGMNLVGEYWEPSFLERVLGDYADKIKIKYIVHYLDEMGSAVSGHRETDLVITNCGKIR